jgi:hypothetical protein
MDLTVKIMSIAIVTLSLKLHLTGRYRAIASTKATAILMAALLVQLFPNPHFC